MNRLLITIFTVLLCYTSSSFFNALLSANKAKTVLDFHQAFITNPSALVQLHLNIKTYFSTSNNRYEDISNKLVEQLGFIKSLKFSGLQSVQFSPENINNIAHGAYSIKFFNVSFEDCVVLEKYKPIHDMFKIIIINGVNLKNGGICYDEWFWQDGKNTLKFVGY